MIPLAIPMALASAIPEIYKLVIAHQQQKLADQYGSAQRPNYTVPNAQTEATAIARNEFNNRQLPGQSTMENKLSAITANTAAKAKEVGNPNTILASLNAANQNQNDAQNFLNTKAAEYHDVNKNSLLNELNRLSPYQQYQFDYNKNQPYQQSMRAASALRNASLRNTESGISGLAGAGNQLMGSFISPYGDSTQPQVGNDPNNPTQNIFGGYNHMNTINPSQDYSSIQTLGNPIDVNPASGLPSSNANYYFDPTTGQKIYGSSPYQFINQ